eukprot:scaffold109205_cov19-Tisochrysis_lutea.AAC.4
MHTYSHTPICKRRHSAEQNLGRRALLTPRASRQQTEQQLQDLTAKVSALQADNAELHRQRGVARAVGLLDEVLRNGVSLGAGA